MGETITVAEVPARLFKYLRQMDQEAVNKSYYGGTPYPTGWREYSNHCKPNLDPTTSPSGVRYEDEWSARLAELFRADGLSVDLFPLYPGSRLRGDLRIHCRGGETLWIEMKGAWRYNLHPRVRGNPVYLKHLTSASEGVPKDFLKIADLNASFASHVGILLIGFVVPAHDLVIAEADVISMKHAAKFNRFSWSEHREEWADGIVADSRVRSWFWYRAASAGSALVTTTSIGSRLSHDRTVGPNVPSARDIPRDEMIKRLRAFVRGKDELFGNRWIWGDYYVELSECCGISAEAPQDGVRKQFTRAIRRILPANAYTFRDAWEAAPEIVAAIRAFHGMD